MSPESSIVIRQAQKTDLDTINRVIESCVMGWDLPERVRRLSLVSYLYHSQDLDHLEMLLAEISGDEIVGVAAWEPAAAADLPQHKCGMLLHGLYVAPRYQHQRIGSRLIKAVLDVTHRQGQDGLLVKAQVDAVGFFQSRGFIQVPVENPKRDYPHRWWKPI